jgi:dihydropteroate synthase
MSHWQTTRFQIDLSRPQVMGIVNLTPDSFSGDGLADGGASGALAQCEQMLRDGADLLDLGAESSRPGAPPVSAQEQLQRLLPVLREALRLGVPISVDTCKPAVMQAVLELGADIINDIWALRQAGALEMVARHGACGVCLMHMHREPQTMQVQPMAGQAMPQVRSFLADAAARVRCAGVAADRIVLDPGVGFGKTVAQNLEMLRRPAALLELGYPLLAAWSRKSTLGAVMSSDQEPVPVTERLPGSLAAALLAVERGARIVRVHEVRQTVQALRLWQAVQPL